MIKTAIKTFVALTFIIGWFGGVVFFYHHQDDQVSVTNQDQQTIDTLKKYESYDEPVLNNHLAFFNLHEQTTN
ncbi:MAG: hypothetical protein HQM16_12470 [Deltaproteobacteria bacterium]|nr:hypothetical protein [Deltaproteobacteria bacterium]